jgi:hypothetical protein
MLKEFQKKIKMLQGYGFPFNCWRNFYEWKVHLRLSVRTQNQRRNVSFKKEMFKNRKFSPTASEWKISALQQISCKPRFVRS